MSRRVIRPVMWALSSAALLLFGGLPAPAAAQAAEQVPATEAAEAQAGEADSVASLFRRGNEFAFDGRWEAAIEVYGALVDFGVLDPDVEQNLGTCYARLGDLPRAIYHYERALGLRPGDEEVEAALSAAEDALAQSRAEAEGEAELSRDTHFARAMVKGVSERGLSIALLLCIALGCASLVVRRRSVREGPRLSAAVAATLFGISAIVTGSGLVVKRRWLAEGDPAIILDDRVELHQSPDARSAVVGEAVRGGERGTAVDRYQGFVRVRVGGRQGWAEESSVGVL